MHNKIQNSEMEFTVPNREDITHQLGSVKDHNRTA